jgi:hypothetical protein
VLATVWHNTKLYTDETDKNVARESSAVWIMLAVMLGVNKRV